jgi:DNA-binding NtrC family response regulator
MFPKAILLAIQDTELRVHARSVLELAGHEVCDECGTADPQVLVCDGFPATRTETPWIFLAHTESEETAIAALRAGCKDYVRQNRLDRELPSAVERCFGIAADDAATGGTAATDAIVGQSAAVRQMRCYLLRVAKSNSNVLIIGETGTGKELVAQLIHANSQRRNRPLRCLNCAAIPDSLIESEFFGHERGAFTGAHIRRDGILKLAHGSTVFLDEVGDMSPYAQAKLLRAIETKEVQRLGASRGEKSDFRVLAATNRPLDSLLEGNGFRKDLYFRLKVACIELPPLRERKEDIPLLVASFIREMNVVFGRDLECISAEALNRLLDYDWPGNIRELRNAIEAAFIDQPHDGERLLRIPAALAAPNGSGKPHNERDRLLGALCATNWNKSETARQLQWSRMTLYRKLAKYHLVRSGALAGPTGKAEHHDARTGR